MMPIALLNAPVITAMGTYRMRPVRLRVAARLVRQRGFVSAIGHKATADLLADLLGVDCPATRIDFRQEAGQHALVFRLDRRLPEGRVLQSRQDIEHIGYSMVLLTRLY